MKAKIFDPENRKWWTLGAVAFGLFMIMLDNTIVNVALPSIQSDLDIGISELEWVFNGYALTFGVLMLTGGKLADLLGRRRIFIVGLVIFTAASLACGLASSAAPLIGARVVQGVGSALMIPPIYILLTIVFSDLESRAKAFGIVSAAAGLGSAAGPLIGGLITSAISWRASFIVQVIVVASIMVMGRQYAGAKGTKSVFDVMGAVLSAAGLVFVVTGILQSGDYGWLTAKKDFMIGDTVIIEEGGISPVWPLVAIGALFLAWFFFHIRSRERAGKEPLLSTRLFRNRVSNLGLVTQNVQWLTLQGSFFVVSVFLQTVRGYNAIETGLVLTASTVGIILSSGIAGRLARRRPQVFLIRGGFVCFVAGILCLLVIADATSDIWTFLPGLFLAGFGIGVMLTSSVNVVQSSWPEQDQGEISGLSRSASNLGSSLGTALVGSVLVSTAFPGNEEYRAALIVMAIIGLIGLGAAVLIPRDVMPAQGQPQATA